jgi:hypothetical protein
MVTSKVCFPPIAGVRTDPLPQVDLAQAQGDWANERKVRAPPTGSTPGTSARGSGVSSSLARREVRRVQGRGEVARRSAPAVRASPERRAARTLAGRIGFSGRVSLSATVWGGAEQRSAWQAGSGRVGVWGVWPWSGPELRQVDDRGPMTGHARLSDRPVWPAGLYSEAVLISAVLPNLIKELARHDLRRAYL